MGFKDYLIFISALAISLHSGHGCEMEGVSLWLIPQQETILDAFRGEFLSRATTNIIGIQNVVFGEGLNGGPYVEVSHANSRFSIQTNNAYEQYEENETAMDMSLTVTFNCAGGTTRPLVFIIQITDTNNNDPRFKPNNEYEFTLIPPLPPGFQITGCFNDIVVRDIDLTTQRIDFEIYDSPYFEIFYDATASTVAKEFKATLRTTTFIRSIPEPIEFKISATDVDLTGNPPRSSNATVRIKSDGQFELPEEPVFTQTFYLATYTEQQEIKLQETISLRQGYSEEVQFILDQENGQFFKPVANGNNVSITVNQLPEELLLSQQILLEIKALRNYTSGASATIIIQMPEKEELLFQQASYLGKIVDNVLQLSELVLSQGYTRDPVIVEIISENSAYFTTLLHQNIITLNMQPLPSSVIMQNNLLTLQVVASTNRSQTSTIVTLEIMKDDGVTPIFERALYEGSYDSESGLHLEPIVLKQGYDDTVELFLEGEQAGYFQYVNNGANITLTASTLPVELFQEPNLILTIIATKPRTVGATSVVSILLPAEIPLEFEQSYYKGVIEDNVLQIPHLVLSQGYVNNSVSVRIQNGSALVTLFDASIDNNAIKITMSPLPTNIIQDNTFFNLEVVAFTNRSSASTIVTLEIIKDDNVTPVFDRDLYEGFYDSLTGLTLSEIILTQGYDETVKFTLNGDHSSFFQIVQSGQHINLTVSSLPQELYKEQNLLLTLTAAKPRTVGANTAISIALPTDRKLRFNSSSYSGTIENGSLVIESIVLEEGYTDDVVFALTGEYAWNFNVSNTKNQISLILRDRLPDSVIAENNFLHLTLSASSINAVTTFTTILLDIIKQDTSTPLFNENIYFGTFAVTSDINIGPIYLTQGYDSTVRFRLDGEFSQYFGINTTNNEVALTLQSAIPEQVIFDEKVLIFSILAEKSFTVGASSAISIAFPTELTHPTELRFSKNIYMGSIQNNILNLEDISLDHGFTSFTVFELSGEYSSSFIITSNNNNVIISLESLPPAIVNSKFITLELKAESLRAVPVTTIVVIDIVQPDAIKPPVFDQAFYRGVYTSETGLQFDDTIYIQDYDSTVSLSLEGESSKWFTISQNDSSLSISLNTSLPEELVKINNQLLFTIIARKPDAIDGRAAVSIDLPKDVPAPLVISFGQASYVGQIANQTLSLPTITLTRGYDFALRLNITGEFASYFILERNANVIHMKNPSLLPVEAFEKNEFITLDIEASYPEAINGYTTVVIALVKEAVTQIVMPVFEEAYYIGHYSAESGLQFENTIQLIQGFDESISLTLAGDDSQVFTLVENATNNFSLAVNQTAIEEVQNRKQLIFSVVASKSNSLPARAAVIITLADVAATEQLIGFDRTSYVGSIVNNTANVGPITVEGYTPAVTLTLHGDLAGYFALDQQGATVTVVLQGSLPLESLPSNRLVVLELQASAPQTMSAFATLVLQVIREDDTVPTPSLPVPVFTEAFYVGNYTEADGLTFNTAISLAQGYDQNVEFILEGASAQWFALESANNSVSLVLSSPIPSAVVTNNRQLLFVVSAQRPGVPAARATIVILMNEDTLKDSSVTFDKVLYEGIVQGGVVKHETITISRYNGTDIHINGEYAALFQATLIDGIASIQTIGPLNLPPEVRHIILELRVADAGAVLILQLTSTDGSVLPTVSFESASYMIRVGIDQFGLVGRVQAFADNGEALVYTLVVDNEHLRTRLSINSEGGVMLSAPVNNGTYSFQTVATTVFTKATGSATVNLTVEELTICENHSIVTDPLIVLNRDEEEPHKDLVILNSTEHTGCKYSLTNRWPIDQKWLYVDDTGLHAMAIDREDPSIAFMTLSQIQVELTLNCNVTRNKRSTDMIIAETELYDYGTNNWVLADTISFNPKKSIVNLIVNDINDNAPTFVDKEFEPLAVGYPVSELEETLMPRSLVELKATDADIGENAALVYWSSEAELAVSPTTGFVHVSNEQQLVHDKILTVYATDQNGAGLSGSIAIMIKLLDTSNIAVITVRDAFLEDEGRILSNLSQSIGYEVKSLRSVVISHSEEQQPTRFTRDTTNNGASLELYVYGLIQREPVSVDRISADINEAAIVTVNIARIQSLEDHLEGLLICSNPGSSVGLLASTIALSILVLILIAIIVWFYINRQRKENYDQFSDVNSTASRNEELGLPEKPNVAASKPRLNIEELKRSEKRLHDMLNAPIDDITTVPSTSTSTKNTDLTYNSVPKIPLPDPIAPIVIQDKLKDAVEESDDDEFGERKKPRRKSVVTFNENVEKIFHVDETPETPDITDSDLEVYKF